METELIEHNVMERQASIDGKLLDCKTRMRFVLISLGSLLCFFSIGYVCFKQIADQYIVLGAGIFFAIILGHVMALYYIIRRGLDLEKIHNEYMIDYSILKLLQKMKGEINCENEAGRSLINLRIALTEGSVKRLEDSLSTLEEKLNK